MFVVRILWANTKLWIWGEDDDEPGWPGLFIWK